MPLGEMRKKERETGAAESEALLARALVGRIGTVGPDGMPYVVPMNFVYQPARRRILLHCAESGHLLDNLAYSPLACFEVDEPGEVMPTGQYACNTSQIYKSVVCFGHARVLNDAVKGEVLRLFVQKYVDQLMPERRYDPKLTEADATVAIGFQVEVMTGKERRAPSP